MFVNIRCRKNSLYRMTEPSPLSTPSGQQRRHHWRSKGRLRAVQALQQPTPPVLRRKCIVSSPLPGCGGKKAKEIMKQDALVSSIPALKSSDGEWVLDAHGKANFLAVTFAEKCKHPRLCCNTYTVCTQCHELQTSVVCPSVEQCMSVLTSLRDDSSTGPDLLPARILKRCAEQPAKPLRSLLQRMLETKPWPESRTLGCPHLQKESRFRSQQL